MITENINNKTFTDKEDHLDIVIGNRDVSTEFQSNIRFQAWGEDVLTLNNVGVKGVTSFDGNEILLSGGDYDERWIRDPSCNALRWKRILHKKPIKSYYAFELGGNWGDFDFSVQDEPATANDLTTFIDPNAGDFSAPGEEWLRWTGLEDGLISECPRSVYGSLAVYHKSKKHNQYRIGKVLHILMPRLTDFFGKTTWATALYIKDGMLYVELPKDFLNSAIYPVVINDTFGYNSVPAAGTNFAAHYCLGLTATSGNAGDLDYLYYYHPESGNHTATTMGLYSSGYASKLVDTDEVDPDTSAQWVQHTPDSSQAIAASTEYCILFHVSGNYTRSAYDTGQGNSERNASDHTYSAGSTPTPPLSMTDYSDRRYGIYADYTASVAGAAGIMTLNTGWWGPTY